MKINLTQNMVMQIIAGAVQIVNALVPSLNPKHQASLAGGVAFLQLIVSHLAQKSNPDGTPASVAYVPTKNL